MHNGVENAHTLMFSTGITELLKCVSAVDHESCWRFQATERVLGKAHTPFQDRQSFLLPLISLGEEVGIELLLKVFRPISRHRSSDFAAVRLRRQPAGYVLHQVDMQPHYPDLPLSVFYFEIKCK